MRRIVVIGTPGAGKSTLAEQLGHVLGIDVFHLDALYWQQGGPPSPEEWAALERDLIRRERWIIDGNYSATLPARLRAADTIVLLDVPTLVCLVRYVRRRVAYRKRDVPGMPPGRRPHVNARALRGIMTFRKDHRPAFLESVAAHAEGRRVVVLRTLGDVRRFLAKVARTSVTPSPDATSPTGPR